MGDFAVAIRERPPPKGSITNNLFPFLTRWSHPTPTEPIPEHFVHIAVFVRVDPGNKWSLTAKGRSLATPCSKLCRRLCCPW